MKFYVYQVYDVCVIYIICCDRSAKKDFALFIHCNKMYICRDSDRFQKLLSNRIFWMVFPTNYSYAGSPLPQRMCEYILSTRDIINRYRSLSNRRQLLLFFSGRGRGTVSQRC
jgi:hypothetical protein